MMQYDARSIYVLKTMEFRDFAEIFRGAQRSTFMFKYISLLSQMFNVRMLDKEAKNGKILLKCCVTALFITF